MMHRHSGALLLLRRASAAASAAASHRRLALSFGCTHASLVSLSLSLSLSHSLSLPLRRHFSGKPEKVQIERNAAISVPKPEVKVVDRTPRDQTQIAAFLEACTFHTGRAKKRNLALQSLTEFADKFYCWQALLNASTRELKAYGLNVKQRKCLLEQIEVYKAAHRRRDMMAVLDAASSSPSSSSPSTSSSSVAILPPPTAIDLQQQLFDVEYAQIYARQWRRAEEQELAGAWRQHIELARMRKKYHRNDWNGVNQSNTQPSLRPLRNPEVAKELFEREIMKLEQLQADGDDVMEDEVNLIEEDLFREEQLEPVLDSFYEQERLKILQTPERLDEYEQEIMQGTEEALGLIPEMTPEEYRESISADEEGEEGAESTTVELSASEDPDEYNEAEVMRLRQQFPMPEADAELSTDADDADAEEDIEVAEEDSEEDALVASAEDAQVSATSAEDVTVETEKGDENDDEQSLIADILPVELGDIDHPYVDMLREIGMPLISLTSRPTDLHVTDDTTQEEMDEEIEKRYEEWSQQYSEYVLDVTRPLHPHYEYSLRQQIRHQFWNYDFDEDYRMEQAGYFDSPIVDGLKDEDYILKEGESVEQWFAKHGTTPDVLAAFERAARRALTGDGRTPKRLEDEADPEEDDADEMLSGQFARDFDDPVDNEQAAAQINQWILEPEEELREHLLSGDGAAAGDKNEVDQLLGIMKRDQQIKQTLLQLDEEEAKVVPKIVQDQMKDQEHLRKVNRRRLNRLFKLKDEDDKVTS